MNTVHLSVYCEFKIMIFQIGKNTWHIYLLLSKTRYEFIFLHSVQLSSYLDCVGSEKM